MSLGIGITLFNLAWGAESFYQKGQFNHLRLIPTSCKHIISKKENEARSYLIEWRIKLSGKEWQGTATRVVISWSSKLVWGELLRGKSMGNKRRTRRYSYEVQKKLRGLIDHRPLQERLENSFPKDEWQGGTGDVYIGAGVAFKLLIGCTYIQQSVFFMLVAGVPLFSWLASWRPNQAKPAQTGLSGLTAKTKNLTLYTSHVFEWRLGLCVELYLFLFKSYNNGSISYLERNNC